MRSCALVGGIWNSGDRRSTDGALQLPACLRAAESVEFEDKGEWLDVAEVRKRFAGQPEILERLLASGERKDHMILGELIRIPRIVDSRKAAEDNEEHHYEEVRRPGARLKDDLPRTRRQKQKGCTDECR